ncbi:MAG: hypothetical protein GX589_02180 [Deltaproteobacteria bacterium]|nr:hypothetical protein [Deltaproteobacteria bacterium]
MSDSENTEALKGQQTRNFESKEGLRDFLLNIRDKMTEKSAAPIYALSALNYVMNSAEIYELLDNENKEIARDIWLRLKQSGLQLKDPPLLFAEGESTSDSVEV